MSLASAAAKKQRGCFEMDIAYLMCVHVTNGQLVLFEMLFGGSTILRGMQRLEEVSAGGVHNRISTRQKGKWLWQ